MNIAEGSTERKSRSPQWYQFNKSAKRKGSTERKSRSPQFRRQDTQRSREGSTERKSRSPQLPLESGLAVTLM